MIVEKHFTLDCKRPDFDHRLSLEPSDFGKMVLKIRNASEMLGSRSKILSEEEENNRRKYQRCLVARKPILSGEEFTPENLGVKRPLPDNRGLAPREYSEILGKTAAQNLATDSPITLEMIGDKK